MDQAQTQARWATFNKLELVRAKSLISASTANLSKLEARLCSVSEAPAWLGLENGLVPPLIVQKYINIRVDCRSLFLFLLSTNKARTGIGSSSKARARCKRKPLTLFEVLNSKIKFKNLTQVRGPRLKVLLLARDYSGLNSKA